MSQQELRNYSNDIKELKLISQQAGMSDEEFKQIYFDSLQDLERRIQDSERRNVRPSQSIISRYKFCIFIALIAVVIICNFKSLYSTVVCNLQEYIYPGLRLVRHISIPFISLFPSLSGLYDESCLIQNPFFTVVDMDCWPCSTISNVREVIEPGPETQLHNAPFVYKSDQNIVTINTLEDLYMKNKDSFDLDASGVFVNNKYYTPPVNMFTTLLRGSSDKSLYIWKINNMAPARLLRQIIPRPKVVPKFGQSTERFIIVDTSQTSFKIPDTECNFSFLLILKGKRQIYLTPAEECKHQCKSLKVDLTESHLLWYNWWYWRPVAQQSFSNVTLVAHVGSYC